MLEVVKEKLKRFRRIDTPESIKDIISSLVQLLGDYDARSQLNQTDRCVSGQLVPLFSTDKLGVMKGGVLGLLLHASN